MCISHLSKGEHLQSWPETVRLEIGAEEVSVPCGQFPSLIGEADEMSESQYL